MHPVYSGSMGQTQTALLKVLIHYLVPPGLIQALCSARQMMRYRYNEKALEAAKKAVTAAIGELPQGQQTHKAFESGQRTIRSFQTFTSNPL